MAAHDRRNGRSVVCRHSQSPWRVRQKRKCDPTRRLPTCPIKPVGVMRFDWITRISIDNLRPLLSLFSADLAIDLGTVNTRIYSRDRDVAVISLSGIVYSRSLRIAGNHMDEAIANYLKRKYNLLIGERTAEQIKIEIGSAYTLGKPLTMEIKGRSLIEGVPKTVTVNDSEIREVLSESVSTIVSAIRMALERTPPELSADISDRGIVLVGGGALLKNLDKRIREETGLSICIADDPLCCVVLGAGKILSDFKLLRKISIE